MGQRLTLGSDLVKYSNEYLTRWKTGGDDERGQRAKGDLLTKLASMENAELDPYEPSAVAGTEAR
jgi:hypothetical protein